MNVESSRSRPSNGLDRIYSLPKKFTYLSKRHWLNITSISHGKVGIVQKIEFEIKTEFGIYNHQNVEKSGFGQYFCVCVSVCLSVLL